MLQKVINLTLKLKVSMLLFYYIGFLTPIFKHPRCFFLIETFVLFSLRVGTLFNSPLSSFSLM